MKRVSRFIIACVVLGAVAWSAFRPIAQTRAADGDAAAPKRAYRILMVTQSLGYEHSSVKRKSDELSVAERTLTDLGISSNLFRVDCTKDVAKDFTKEKLAQYDIVFFYTTTPTPPPNDNNPDPPGLPISDEEVRLLLQRLKQKDTGSSASTRRPTLGTSTSPTWDMISATFDGHPWGNGSLVTITVHDTKHPAMKPWGEEFQIQDEIYRFKHWQPEKVHVLMSMNMAKTGYKEPYHVPIAWCKDYGNGKVFYMSLGHDEKVWANPKYQESLLGAIKWELNLEPGDATPNPEVSKAQDEKSKADYAEARKDALKDK